MKIQLLFLLILLIVISSTGLMATEESLRLDLNVEDIAEVRFSDNRAIHLKLSDSATLKLKHLTAENTGKKLSITYMNHVIVTATIQAMIPSGRISISKPSDFIRKEMKKLQEQLSENQKMKK